MAVQPPTALIVALTCTVLSSPLTWGKSPQVRIRQTSDRLEFEADGVPIATYVFRDDQILRPYFAHVKTRSGTQVTRNHPPIEGVDRSDHATMHPGIWMAFGDIGGHDFWRNKSQITHERFDRIAVDSEGRASFVESKLYRNGDTILCRETFRCTIELLDAGWLLHWDSTFSPADSKTIAFGDQEEMGLGIRVATSITERAGGTIRDSEGRVGAKQVWSQASRWCDYSGMVGNASVGMTILCHPDNFRDSWMHARDYGLIAANCFGRKAMGKGKPSQVIISADEPLQLRYAVWIHATPGGRTDEIERVYQRF